MNMQKKLDLSIVIISFNTLNLTKQCINSIKKYIKNLKYEIIVIDNGSTDGSFQYLSKLSSQDNNFVLVKNSENLGFAAGNNIGIKKSKGNFVLFLNSDTKITHNVMPEMLDYMNMKDLGILSCKLIGSDGVVQGNGGYFPTLIRVFSWMIIQDLPFVDRVIRPFHPLKPKSLIRNEKFYNSVKDLDWVTGAFVLVKKDLLREGVTWDADYFMYTEDVDFCYQAKRLGWKIEYNPRWSIIHYGGASSNKEFAIVSEFMGIKRFYKKFYPKWQFILLRWILKTGTLLRALILSIIEGKELFNIYVKAFRTI